MLKNYLFLLVALIASAFGVNAQVVTTDPPLIQEDSQNVVVYFHADRGSKGLMNSPASTAIYAHTGVCVEDANGVATDWKYAPAWGSNLPKYQLEYVSPNLWKLNIGNIRTYYGVAANETIKKLAFVFRNANSTKEGKGDNGSDIFVDVVDTGFQLALTSSVTSSVVSSSTGAVTFTAATTEVSNISIAVNGSPIATTAAGLSVSGNYTFSNTGNYEVTATAVAGGKTLTRTLYYCNPTPSQPGSGAVPAMGATRNADGSVTFCIAAPQKKTALIVGSWNDYRVNTSQVMNYIDGPANGQGSFRYFTITLNDIPVNQPVMYYYVIDGIAVGDPYARLVLDPYSDKYISSSAYPNLPAYPQDKVNGVCLALFQDNYGEYNWNVKNFKGAAPDNLVIYEMLFRDFTGTEGKADGNGTVRLAIEKIPYLKELGVNAVELLPINEFNGNISWGYNPNFYFAIDKAYGTVQDYKEFIDKCHENGIAVILDVVFNQSDGMHPWYQLYSPGSNPFYNKTAPHAYSVLNDWNQGYPLVQQQWNDMLKYWITEYKIDGYRFDLVKGLGDNNSYANSGDAATNAYNASRVARMKALHNAIREVKPDAYFINENLAGAQEENEMAADGELNWMNLNNAGCEFAMGYPNNGNLNSMLAKNAGRTVGSTVAYLESHDEERLAYKQQKYGASGIKGNAATSCRRLASAAAQMILVPGSHMIWQFSELGNAQTTKNSNGGNNTDPKIVNWGLMDVPSNAALLKCYQELIHIRLGNPDLFSSKATAAINFAGTGIRTASYVYGDQELYLFINSGTSSPMGTKANFKKADNNAYRILSKSEGAEPTVKPASQSVTVPANGYVVVASNNVTSDVTDIIAGDEALSVSSNNGTIFVNGAVSPVSIWSVAGTMVAYSEASSMEAELPAGVYVVKSGSKSVKVMVK